MALCQQSSAGFAEQNHYRWATFPDSCHTKTTRLLWFVLWQTGGESHRTQQHCRKHTDRRGSHETVIFPRSVKWLQWPWRSKHNIPEKKQQHTEMFHRVFLRKVALSQMLCFTECRCVFCHLAVTLRAVERNPPYSVCQSRFKQHCRKTPKASRFRDWEWFIHTHISADCTGWFCWFHFLRKWNCDIGTGRTSSDSAALAFSLSVSQSLTWGRFPSVFLSFSLPLRLSLYSITCMHDLHRYSPLLTIYTFLL